jgi:hypothetical protein
MQPGSGPSRPPTGIDNKLSVCFAVSLMESWGYTPELAGPFLARQHAATCKNKRCAMRKAEELVNLLHCSSSSSGRMAAWMHKRLRKQRRRLLVELVQHVGLNPCIQEDITYFNEKLHACCMKVGPSSSIPVSSQSTAMRCAQHLVPALP